MIYSQYIINLYGTVNVPKSSTLHRQTKCQEGGFKDVDLQSKFTSCTAIWIRKMVNNMDFHSWVVVGSIILKDFGSANIFHTNLSLLPRMQAYLQNIPLFKVSGITALSIFNSELQSKGIKTVFDLIDGQGNFSSWNPLAEKFNLSAVGFL